MKNSPLTTILLVLLVISALGSVVLCWSYISHARELRTLQTQAAMVNNNRALVNALIGDALEYSKKNPAIEPILDAIGAKPRAAAAAAKPAAK